MSEYFGSVAIYLFTFIFSIGFFWIGQRLYDYKKNSLGVFLGKIAFLIAVLLPSLLAGFRANSVGTDIEVYIVPDMRVAASAQVHSFWDCCTMINRVPEYLYMLLVYICSRFTADEGLLLFMIQLLTIGPFALAAIKLRKEISVPLAMTTYLLCFYNSSLNNMRQSVVCAFILLGAVYLLNNETKINLKTVVCFAVACLFHKTGIIGVVSIYLLCKVPTWRALKRWAYVAIYAGIIALPIIITPIFELLNARGLMNETYNLYANIFLYRRISNDWSFTVSPFTFSMTLMSVCWLGKLLLPCFFLRRYAYFSNAKITAIRSMAICGTMIYMTVLYAMRTIYGMRISLFFDVFLVLLVPYAANCRPNKTIKKVLMCVMMLAFWFVYVMIMKWSETYFYQFRF